TSRIFAECLAPTGLSGVPTSSAGRERPGARGFRWASQSNPSSLYSSPAWILISPTSSRVSLSVANVIVPATLIARIALSLTMSYTTACPSRTSTRAPAPGTRPSSHVAAADHGPERAERLTAGGSAACKLVAAEARTSAYESMDHFIVCAHGCGG